MTSATCSYKGYTYINLSGFDENGILQGRTMERKNDKEKIKYGIISKEETDSSQPLKYRITDRYGNEYNFEISNSKDLIPSYFIMDSYKSVSSNFKRIANDQQEISDTHKEVPNDKQKTPNSNEKKSDINQNTLKEHQEITDDSNIDQIISNIINKLAEKKEIRPEAREKVRLLSKNPAAIYNVASILNEINKYGMYYAKIEDLEQNSKKMEEFLEYLDEFYIPENIAARNLYIDIDADGKILLGKRETEKDTKTGETKTKEKNMEISLKEDETCELVSRTSQNGKKKIMNRNIYDKKGMLIKRELRNGFNRLLLHKEEAYKGYPFIYKDNNDKIIINSNAKGMYDTFDSMEQFRQMEQIHYEDVTEYCNGDVGQIWSKYGSEILKQVSQMEHSKHKAEKIYFQNIEQPYVKEENTFKRGLKVVEPSLKFMRRYAYMRPEVLNDSNAVYNILMFLNVNPQIAEKKEVQEGLKTFFERADYSEKRSAECFWQNGKINRKINEEIIGKFISKIMKGADSSKWGKTYFDIKEDNIAARWNNNEGREENAINIVRNNNGSISLIKSYGGNRTIQNEWESRINQMTKVR